MPLFNAHHYNVLAKEIRELWPDYNSEYELEINDGKANVLSQLVLNLSKRFAVDNPNFNPSRFMEAAIPTEVRERIIREAMS